MEKDNDIKNPIAVNKKVAFVIIGTAVLVGIIIIAVVVSKRY